MMKILRADSMGWCFGVRDAVALVERRARVQPVTVLGELVHNDAVNAALAAQGVRLTRRVEEIATDTVIITAHGASEATRARARQQAGTVLEATCPLVRAAHQAVRDLVAAGFHPVIVGQRGHVEVRGLTEDLAHCDVILTADDVAALTPRPKFGIAAQTTQPLERVRELVELIRRRFPQAEVRWVDTVCRPTKLRQAAAVALARRCDVVVVVGGFSSNNTNELARTSARFGARVVRIETAAELDPRWFDGAALVGLTAGTSTPDAVIEEVDCWLQDLAAERNAEPTAEPVGVRSKPGRSG